jgi:hypothetical protein
MKGIKLQTNEKKLPTIKFSELVRNMILMAIETSIDGIEIKETE